MIDPQFWSDEKIANLKRDTRLLFIGMWNFADDVGIIKSRSEFLKSSIFPFDNDVTNESITSMVEELVRENLIFEYVHTGQHFSIILNFRKHQVINKPLVSKLPMPNIGNRKYQEAIYKRDEWTCYLCGDCLEGNYISKDGKDKMPSVDHVIPTSKGGNNLPQNLKTACLCCNVSKGDMELEEYYRSSTVVVRSQMKGNEMKETVRRQILPKTVDNLSLFNKEKNKIVSKWNVKKA